MQYNKASAGTAPEAQESVARSNLSKFLQADATSIHKSADSFKQRYDCGKSGPGDQE